MTGKSRRALLRNATATLAGSLAFPAIARAQAAWPSKPIRCIVPLPPGGGTDATGGVAMQRLSEALGVPVVIENRAGAGGTVGSEASPGPQPDGYTIGIATASSHPAAPMFRKDLPYDPVKSFTAITMIGTTPYILIGGPAAGATDLPGFVAAAKAKPGKVDLRLGRRVDAGLPAHQAVRTAGRHRDGRRALQGSAQVYPDLMNGTVAVMLDNPSGSAGLVRDGTVDRLCHHPAVGHAAARADLLEPRHRGLRRRFLVRLMGPAGMPTAIADRIQQALAQAFLTDPGRAELRGDGRRSRHVDAGGVRRDRRRATPEVARAGRSPRHQARNRGASIMDGSHVPPYRVNELTPDPNVTVRPEDDSASYVNYAHRLAARGLVNSSVGGMVIRVPHPDYADGICYAKPQGISLEEVEVEDLVITDIPYGRLLRGERATTVGHQMNREMLRLRPDVNCVIHLHHDETIAFLAAGYEEIRSSASPTAT